LTAVQLKQYREVVPRRFVDELRGAMLRQRADQGLLIATSTFSALAVEAARDPALPAIHLIDGVRLIEMLLDHQLGVRVITIQSEPATGSTPRPVFDASFFDELETRAERQKGDGLEPDRPDTKSNPS